jgi:phospholipid/cholesterol/gamma-HCH transport system ATP-binding protein
VAEHDPIIQIDDLHYAYDGREVFSGLSLSVRRGAVTALMGPSGTGKTTLLKLVGGQLRPQRGTVVVDGQDVHKLRRSELYALRKRMGMLFQTGALLTDLKVFDNVAFPLREHTRLGEQMIRDVVLMKLEAVGLRGARELMPSELSGGMARRVALARAIALDPMMIMYDEPFTGLDPITKGTIVSLIRQLNETLGLTSIVVSHDVRDTLGIAHDAYVISEGKVVEAGTADAVARTRSPWARQFLDGLPDGPVPFHYPAADYAEDLLQEAR